MPKFSMCPVDRIELGVRGERAHMVELAVKIVFAARFERHRIELVRQRLLAERQQRAGERIHADVDRRLQHEAPAQPVARERRAESAIDKAAGRVLFVPAFVDWTKRFVK